MLVAKVWVLGRLHGNAADAEWQQMHACQAKLLLEALWCKLCLTATTCLNQTKHGRDGPGNADDSSGPLLASGHLHTVLVKYVKTIENGKKCSF